MAKTVTGLNLVPFEEDVIDISKYPENEYSGLIKDASAQHNVPYNILYNLLKTESNFNAKATNPSGAKGIAQFMDATAKEQGVDPMDPKSAIPGAAGYLKQQFDRFGNWDHALAAYNAGPGNVRKYGGIPPFKETQNYVSKILEKDVEGADKVKRKRAIKGKTGDLSLTPFEGDGSSTGLNLVPFEEDRQLTEEEKLKLDSIRSSLGDEGRNLSSEEEGKLGDIRSSLQPETRPFQGKDITKKFYGNMFGVNTADEGDNMRMGQAFSDVFRQLRVLKGRPDYVFQGLADFGLSIPGFMAGVVDAGTDIGRKVLDRVVLGSGELNLSDMYDDAAETMQRNMEYFEPAKEQIIGEVPEESRLIGEVAMAPMTGMSMLGHKVAGWEGFKDYPNIQGAAKFAGDIAGLAAMGMIMHGRSERGKVVKDIEESVTKADEIIRKEKLVEDIPNELLKQVQRKVLEAEKVQLELKNKDIAERISKDAQIREELLVQSERLAQEKMLPVQGRPEATFTSKKGNVYNQVDGVWLDSSGNKVTNNFKLRAIKKGVEKQKEVKVDPVKEGVVPDGVKIKQTKTTPTHGTDIDALDGILKDGLNEGSAIDISKDRAWSSESPIQIEIPDVKKGEYVEHNKYYKSVGQTKPSKVIVNLDNYRPQYTQEILDKVNILKEKYPDVKWEIKGESPKADTFNVKNLTNHLKKEFGLSNKEAREMAKDEVSASNAGDPKNYYGYSKSEFYTIGEWQEYFDWLSKDVKEIDSSKIKQTKEKEIELSPKELAEIAKEEAEFNQRQYEKLDNELKSNREEQSKADVNSEEYKDLKYREEEIMDQIGAYKTEPITEVDTGTGTKVPNLEGEKSPFYQEPIKSAEMADVYKDKSKAVSENVEIFTQKVINDVNQWYNKQGEIDIDGARNALSDLAARSEELRGEFITAADHMAWAETVKEAASWARRLIPDRVDLKRTRPKLSMRDKLHRYEAINTMANTSGGSTAVPVIHNFKHLFTNNEVKSLFDYFTTEGSNRQSVKKVTEATGIEGLVDHKGNEVIKAKPKDTKPKELTRQEKIDKLYETLNEKVEEAEIGSPLKDVKVITRKKGGGVKLTSGVDPTQGIKAIVDGAKGVAGYVKKARGLKRFDPRLATKLIKEEVVRSVIDKSGNIRRDMIKHLGQTGYEVVQKMVLSKGASSVASNRLKQMNKEVYEGLSKKERNVLDTLILADRIADIGKYKSAGKFKFPKGLEPTNVVAYSELFGQVEGLSPSRVQVIRNRAQAYFEWMKKPLKDMLESGLISQVEYDALIGHNYRKLKLVEIFDIKKPDTGKKGRSVYDSGVEALSHGRDTDIFEPSSEIMALEVFNRAYGRILNNEANKNLYDVAKTDPQNSFVRIKKDNKDKIPSGWTKSHVYIDGKKETMWLSPEMSKEWITSNPEISYKASQVLRYASGSPVLRTFATGINWGFAMANLPRDIMHAWYSARTWKDGEWSSVYSPTAPVAGLQIGADLGRTFSDALLRKGRYQKYVNEGGGMEFLTHQGRLTRKGRHLEGRLDKVMNFMGYFGETTEIMTRLAIRDRVIRNRAREQGLTIEQARKNKKITEEATFAARDYMDFGQGGTLSKAADNAMPYLNATLQGTRGMFRSFTPGSGTALSSTYKLSQFAALTAGLTIAAWKMHPETMENLRGNVDAENNMIIPLGDDFGFEDERGQMRYPYIKIPLDPGQKFFKTFFEASTYKWLGKEVDVDRVVDSLKSQSPVGVGSLPPTISGPLGYVTNKDFWLNEDIWRKTDRPFSWPNSKEEYIPGRTPQAFVDFGEATGMSPERTKYMVEELTTSGTVWSELLGAGYDGVFSDLPKSNKEQHLAKVLSDMPIAKRFIGVTNPYSKHAGKIEKANEKAVIERFKENRGLDALAEGYLYQDNVSRKEVVDYIYDFRDRDTRDRLKERLRFQEKTRDLPERSFWLRLQGVPLEARAQVFVQRLEASSPEKQKQLWKEYAIVKQAKGIISKEFRREVRKVMSE